MLGATLTAAYKKHQPGPALKTDRMQLTGRTQHDQIVVFDGPETLTGSLLKVRVRHAHGLTIFADLVPAISPENAPALSVLSA